jgi:hypothetical protein
MAFFLFLLATATADFTYTAFTGKQCSPANATLVDTPHMNGVCVSHFGSSAIVDCGPSGLVFNVWKWAGSSTCSGVPDVSLVAPTGSCEAFGDASLLINCKAPEKLNSAGSLAQRLLAKKKGKKTTTTTTTPAPTTKKPKKKKKDPIVRAQATASPSPSACPATGAPFPATNAQGTPISVFPEGNPNNNGRNTCGQIKGPSPTTPTPSRTTNKPTTTKSINYYDGVATPAPHSVLNPETP